MVASQLIDPTYLARNPTRVCVVSRGLGIERIHIVSHPPAEEFYRSVGAVRVGEIPPAGRITWSRPLLRIDIATTRS
jgi:hypothetical protein